MSDLVERVSRSARPSLWRAFDAEPDSGWTAEKRHQELVSTGRVILALLAAQLAPSAAVLAAGRNAIDPAYPPVSQAAHAWADMLGAFAREHGLDPPPAEEQQP